MVVAPLTCDSSDIEGFGGVWSRNLGIEGDHIRSTNPRGISFVQGDTEWKRCDTIDGAHLFKEVASGKGGLPTLFVQRAVMDNRLQGPSSEESCDSRNEAATMQPDAMEAEWKSVAEGGCA